MKRCDWDLMTRREQLGKKGQSVGAGFIADVDLDGQTDLVLAFGSSLYVTTYMGRDAAKVGKFPGLANADRLGR
ncbi:MAG: hypothetical protein U0787_16555 [Polyangia bacterium]